MSIKRLLNNKDKDNTSAQMQLLLSSCAELSSLFPDGLVFIGGIAVYLYSVNFKQTSAFAEFTHDADFYISISDMSDLRDIEELTPNRRLNKHQLIKNGFEFDIYTERYSSLIVPYDQIKAYAEQFDILTISSLEHLLVLKLEAYKSRRASSKGLKDAKDILRITQICSARATKLRKQLIEPYVSDEHLKLLHEIEKSPAIISLAKGNSQLAKQIRKIFISSTAILK